LETSLSSQSLAQLVLSRTVKKQNKNNKITQFKKEPSLTAQQTHRKESRLKERTDRAWFNHLLQHLGRVKLLSTAVK